MLHVFLYITFKNMMLDLDHIFYQISLSILLTFRPIVYEYYREKLHVNHFWELKSEPFNSFHPNISMHILLNVLFTFPKALTRRICFTIKGFSS